MSQFNEAEIAFILQSHRPEHADGTRELRGAIDLRTLGCPDRVFESVLRSRSQKLGARWHEFRSAQRATGTTPLASDLDTEVLKLF
jgi:hypothetical protein